MDADIERLRHATLDEVGELPVEIRDDWRRYFDQTVVDMWSRPGMSARNRSIVTVAALATMGCSFELRAHVGVALRHGLSRKELCEVVMQVGGYAGLGRGSQAMRDLRAAFGDEPDLRPPGQHTDEGFTPAADDHERLTRARETMSVLRPPTVASNLAKLDCELTGVRAPGVPEPSPWFRWLNMTAFGDLWTRPNLALDERERATVTILTVLGLADALRPHCRIALNVGIPPAELIEMMLHLGVYAGFPTMTLGSGIASAVIAEHGAESAQV
jgi:4-carboxymuconolactone decarboxylase